jgi:hypothetical protein
VEVVEVPVLVLLCKMVVYASDSSAPRQRSRSIRQKT